MKLGPTLLAALALAAGEGATAQPRPAASTEHPTVRGVRKLAPGQAAVGEPAAEPVSTPRAVVQRAAEPACDRVFPHADLVFSDTVGFDQTLRAQLRAAEPRARVIDVPAFAPNAPPPRLANWFAEVQRTGGTLRTRDMSCAATRNFSLARLIAKLFTAPSESLYAPARDFSVVLWTDKADGRVKQVQFIRRAQNS